MQGDSSDVARGQLEGNEGTWQRGRVVRKEVRRKMPPWMLLHAHAGVTRASATPSRTY